MNIEIIAGALYRLQRETRCQMSFFVFHREIDSALGLNTCMNTTNLQGEEKVVFTDASVLESGLPLIVKFPAQEL
jgi:hypothetical protein